MQFDCLAHRGPAEFASGIYGQIIVTSYLFPDAKFSLERLQKVSSVVGKDKLVVDVRCVPREFRTALDSDFFSHSCRKRGGRWFVAMNKWQDITDMEVSQGREHLESRGVTY